ncbi:hypothetical protein BJY17_001985 [Agromyces hippuratus]|uniref:Uncharacterized protein n=1 Tax=Agromyces hippuratus TaxID=286438 RepID=A0A852WUJ9_9MICO|nr:hypothetical protein [Agromyces hippuratus]NYG21238.1 hypothetical protein [Agromyces hippuratus]
MNGQQHCEYSAADFEATVIEATDTRLIHVSGYGLCASQGWTLQLVAANPGVVPHPESLWLEIRETPPPNGAPSRVLTETSVEAMIEDAHAKQVVIRFRWREGFVLPLRERVGALR